MTMAATISAALPVSVRMNSRTGVSRTRRHGVVRPESCGMPSCPAVASVELIGVPPLAAGAGKAWPGTGHPRHTAREVDVTHRAMPQVGGGSLSSAGEVALDEVVEGLVGAGQGPSRVWWWGAGVPGDV